MIFTFQRHDKRKEYYGLVIPGSKIPKWLSHKNVGTSVNLQVPSSDLLCNKFMGIVLCVVFVYCQHPPFDQLQSCSVGFFGTFMHELRCSINADGCEIDIRSLLLSEEFGKIESHQLWVEYVPSTHFEANGFSRIEILNKLNANRFSQIEVKFEAQGPGLEVTKCGAHLVFERDIINQTKAGPSSCIITPYDDSDGEGVGPIGEATSNDIDIPHPKSVQLPNLIQRLMLCLGNWTGSLCAQRQGDSDCEEEEFQ